MQLILFIALVVMIPGAYTGYLSYKESAVSGRIALRRKEKRDREREERLRLVWQAKSDRHAARLAAWRESRQG